MTLLAVAIHPRRLPPGVSCIPCVNPTTALIVATGTVRPTVTHVTPRVTVHTLTASQARVHRPSTALTTLAATFDIFHVSSSNMVFALYLSLRLAQSRSFIFEEALNRRVHRRFDHTEIGCAAATHLYRI